MPTSEDYRLSAVRLRYLSGDLQGVMRPTQRGLPPARLSGGLLAAKVEEVIARRATDARAFAGGVQDLATECRARYEQARQLDFQWFYYDNAYDGYLIDIEDWEVARDLYVADPFAAPHPGPPPEEPSPPSPIPDWYERTRIGD